MRALTLLILQLTIAAGSFFIAPARVEAQVITYDDFVSTDPFTKTIAVFRPGTVLIEKASIIYELGPDASLNYRLDLKARPGQDGVYDLIGYVKKQLPNGQWLHNRISNGEVCIITGTTIAGPDEGYEAGCPAGTISFPLGDYGGVVTETTIGRSEIDFEVDVAGCILDQAYDFNLQPQGFYLLSGVADMKKKSSCSYGPIQSGIDIYVIAAINQGAQLVLAIIAPETALGEAAIGAAVGAAVGSQIPLVGSLVGGITGFIVSMKDYVNLFINPLFEEVESIAADFPKAVVSEGKLALRALIRNNYYRAASSGLVEQLQCTYSPVGTEVKIKLSAPLLRYSFGDDPSVTVPKVAADSETTKIEGYLTCRQGGFALKQHIGDDALVTASPVDIQVYANCEGQTQVQMALTPNCAQRADPQTGCAQIDLLNLGPEKCTPAYGAIGAIPLYKINLVRGITSGTNPIAFLLQRISDVLVRIAGAIAVFMLVYAGFVYVQSRGREEQISKAKNLVKGTVTALVIIFLAYIIITVVQGIFYGAEKFF